MMMAGRSPPRHRHDGSSPLPLGIDASPAPARWNGAQTEWPHDPRTGWSYCVFIPSWVVLPEAKDSDGKFINNTVFFRVQVGIQSPDGISTLRTTLRRFSDFLKLSAALKKLFPKKKLPTAPPKNSLMRMNSNHSLLQERRQSLEDWMGRLLADIDISRSVPLASFLELEAAVRSAAISISEAQSQLNGAVGHPAPLHHAPSLRSGQSWTGGGSSVASGGYSNLDYGSDVNYDNSVVGTPSKGSEGGLEIEMEALAVEEQSAINAAAETRGENLQQSTSSLAKISRDVSEEVGLESQPQASPSEDLAPSEISEKDVPGEQETQVVETENRGGMAGVSFANSGLSHALSLSVGSLEPRHRRRTSQESIISEVSSAPGSELSRGISMDVPIESPLWGLSAGDLGEGGGSTGTGADYLKGVGLILPVDHRSKVRRVMVALQRRLAATKTDMEDLLARLNQETAVKEFLTTKVRDLEGELDGMRRKSREVLQQAVLLERERVTTLQWELEECRVALQSAEEIAHSQQGIKTDIEEGLQDALTKCDNVEKELMEVRQQMQLLQHERDAVDAQARADKKVLAKEIKSLRASQVELKQETKQAIQAKVAMEASLQVEKQKQEKARVSQTKFLHEIAMLWQRLRECSVDVLAREEEKLTNKDGAAGTTNASDLLSTSDNRIGLLLAEAQLLVQEDDELQKVKVSVKWSPIDPQSRSNGDSGVTPNSEIADKGSESILRKMLIEAFIEQAQLQKAMNSLVRKSLLSGQQQDSNSKPSEETGFSRKSLIEKFI